MGVMKTDLSKTLQELFEKLEQEVCSIDKYMYIEAKYKKVDK